MKSLYTSIITGLIVFFTVSCNKSKDITLPPAPIEPLNLIAQSSIDDEIVELYSTSKNIQVGYNKFWIKIINKHSKTPVQVTHMTWKPVMYMTSMSHSTPHSSLQTSLIKEYQKEGYIIFTMPSDADGLWELEIDYSIDKNNKTVKIKLPISALKDNNKNIQSFTHNGTKYTLAMVEPTNPKMGSNLISAVILKKVSDESDEYQAVNNWKITIDPRMPGMGNHSSPNNKDLVQNNAIGEYFGSLNLTMTGYWLINLRIWDQDSKLIKGEEITNENEKSSIQFEIEF